MVRTDKVEGDLRHIFANNSFFVSGFYCVVEKRLALVLTCVLYCLMAVIGEIELENRKYECMGGYEMLQVAIQSGVKCNVVACCRPIEWTVIYVMYMPKIHFAFLVGTAL